MDEEILSITVEESGERIDALLARSVTGLSRSAAQRLIEQGAVRLEGRAVQKNTRCEAGMRITVTMPETEEVPLVPQDLPLNIVYEDDDLIVINKARGMVVHPAPGHPDGTLVNALLFHCGDSLSGIGGEKRPGIVHRIDKDTSGLLIAAKNDFAHQALSAQLQDHTLGRIYEAITVGGIREDAGTIDAPIGRNPKDRKKMAVTTQHSRPAVTHFEVLERFRDYNYIKCRLDPRRTHQIRVHMAYRGHPVAGDPLYGPSNTPKSLQGQCLHAGLIGFIHPTTGEYMEFTSELPETFTKFLRGLESTRTES